MSGELVGVLFAVIMHLTKILRITGCRIVSDEFSCRNHALHRSYLYRLAVLKSEYDRDPIHLNHPSTLIPLIEQNRCWPIRFNFFLGKRLMFSWLSAFYHSRSDFNLDLFKAAAKEFIGEKNVASFMGSPRSNIKSQKKRQLRNPDSLIAEPQVMK